MSLAFQAVMMSTAMADGSGYVARCLWGSDCGEGSRPAAADDAFGAPRGGCGGCGKCSGSSDDMTAMDCGSISSTPTAAKSS